MTRVRVVVIHVYKMTIIMVMVIHVFIRIVNIDDILGVPGWLSWLRKHPT